MRKSVSFQPIGRQPPKDTANQQQGRHARLFSYPATRDARIKFWDFGRTGMAHSYTQGGLGTMRKSETTRQYFCRNKNSLGKI